MNDPSLSDTLYEPGGSTWPWSWKARIVVEELIGPDTISTMPEDEQHFGTQTAESCSVGASRVDNCAVLAIRVGDDVYELSEESSRELISRLPGPPLEGGEPAAGSLHDKLRVAAHGQEPAVLDRSELAITGVVIEAWATELGVDAADVQELRDAIAREVH